MCSGSKSNLCPFDLEMEAGFQEDKRGFLIKNCSKLLELAATDDLPGFIYEVEERGSDVNEASFWYGRSFGSKKMGFEERTPIMIASLYGSTEVLKYIVGTCKVDVNKACGSDGATALHCAAAGGSWSSVEVVELLIGASGDIIAVDAEGKKPGDLIAPCVKSSSSSKRKTLEMLLNGTSIESGDLEDEEGSKTPLVAKEGSEKKEYPIDVSLPDINNGIYGTDEFRMYNFKVKPCSRAYSHDWTECPFVHPGENARRRDPRKYNYTCVPCPEFKKGSCAKGDGCEYAHGVFESWLHPAQYRTRLCKDETGCSRKVCFFAHKPEELRPLYASTGSAMPSPKSVGGNSLDLTTLSPLSLGSSSLMLPNTSTPPMSPTVTCSSPMGGSMWQNKVNLTPPALQLQGSRLKTTLTARDVELQMELLGLDKICTQQQRQQLVDEMASLSSPYSRIGDLKPTNLDDFFGSLDSEVACSNPGEGESSYLECGKFLLVLDDVWRPEDWDKLQIALPKYNKSSKVLITSCQVEVGRYANPIRDPHMLRFLTLEESWLLLRLLVFGKPEFPSELEVEGKLIAKQCGGLPLATVVKGGILVKKYSASGELNARQNAWRKASASISTSLNDDAERRMEKII